MELISILIFADNLAINALLNILKKVEEIIKVENIIVKKRKSEDES